MTRIKSTWKLKILVNNSSRYLFVVRECVAEVSITYYLVGDAVENKCNISRAAYKNDIVALSSALLC